MKRLLFILPLLLCVFQGYTQTASQEIQDGESIFEEITSQNRFIESLAALANAGNQAQNMPMGIKKLIGNIPLTLAVSNVKLGENYGELSLMARIQIPQQSKTLIFGASGIGISNKGDLIGDANGTKFK